MKQSKLGYHTLIKDFNHLTTLLHPNMEQAPQAAVADSFVGIIITLSLLLFGKGKTNQN